MKRARYVVHLPEGHVARFSNPKHALRFAREMSRLDSVIYTSRTIEVSAPDGLIGQFCDGFATHEFAHLDRTAAEANAS